jgi:hypothetical protein
MPIKENPGEPALQSAASDGQCHTPREHNLNYTIWPLYAESVSFPINATLLWGARSGINQTILHARTEIHQAILRTRTEIQPPMPPRGRPALLVFSSLKTLLL